MSPRSLERLERGESASSGSLVSDSSAHDSSRSSLCDATEEHREAKKKFKKLLQQQYQLEKKSKRRQQYYEEFEKLNKMRIQAGRYGGNIGKQLKDYQNQQEKQKNSSASSRKKDKRSSIISKEGAPSQGPGIDTDTDLRIFIATKESGHLGVASKEAELFASRMG